MPVLEDVLGSFAAILSPAKPGTGLHAASIPRRFIRSAPAHRPRRWLKCLAEKPLAKLGMKLIDVDRYGVELHNPEITVPSGSGDVPRTNYLTLAALAVMRGQIQKNQMEDFVRSRGMLGYAPTQGHIPSAIVYLGHAMDALQRRRDSQRFADCQGQLVSWPDDATVGRLFFLVDRNEV